MSTSTADRRKIRKLEEDLEESEKNRKKFEREKQRLERDLKELQEKFDNVSTSSKDNEWKAKQTETVLDNKSLERTISTLETEIERLKKELKSEKEKTSQAHRGTREALRSDVDIDAIKRHDFETQLTNLQKQLQIEKETHEKYIEQLKAEFESKDNSGRQRSAHLVGGGNRVFKEIKGGAGSGASFDNFSKNLGSTSTINDENIKELKELRKKLEIEETNAEREKKKI